MFPTIVLAILSVIFVSLFCVQLFYGYKEICSGTLQGIVFCFVISVILILATIDSIVGLENISITTEIG